MRPRRSLDGADPARTDLNSALKQVPIEGHGGLWGVFTSASGGTPREIAGRSEEVSRAGKGRSQEGVVRMDTRLFSSFGAKNRIGARRAAAITQTTADQRVGEDGTAKRKDK